METGLPAVRRFLVQYYTLDDLRTLCADLGANYDDLAGETLSSKARELLLWAGRQHKLEKLLAELRASRQEFFAQAGLSLEPSAVERLYGALAAFESSTAPQSGWTRFRRRPRVFYPSLALAVILVFVLLVSGLVSIAGGAGGARQQLQAWGLLPARQAFAPAVEDEILVVIATFQRREGVADVGAQDEIRRAIRQAADKAGFTGLRVEVEPAQLAAEDQAGARALGERYRASMVIWGQITAVRVTVNYLSLKQPAFAAQVRIEETERTQLANPSAYSSFITQDLPGRMTFLALFAVGQSFYSQKRYDESVRAIESAVAEIGSGTIEGLAEAYFRLGWLYQHKPDPDKQRAIAGYTKAIDLKSDYAIAYNNRGVARYDSGDQDGAIDDYDKAIELDSAYVLAYFNRGHARRRSGDLAGAIADYTELSKLAPDDAAPLINLCRTYVLEQQAEQALPTCERAVKLDPLPGYRDSRGIVYALLGRYDAAIEDFQASIHWLAQQPGPEYQAKLAQRKQWVTALHAGQNPITPEVLAELRTEN